MNGGLELVRACCVRVCVRGGGVNKVMSGRGRAFFSRWRAATQDTALWKLVLAPPSESGGLPPGHRGLDSWPRCSRAWLVVGRQRARVPPLSVRAWLRAWRSWARFPASSWRRWICELSRLVTTPPAHNRAIPDSMPGLVCEHPAFVQTATCSIPGVAVAVMDLSNEALARWKRMPTSALLVCAVRFCALHLSLCFTPLALCESAGVMEPLLEHGPSRHRAGS